MKTYPSCNLIGSTLLVAAATLAACGDDEPAPGSLEIAIYGEEFIEQGIGDDVFVDGWSVVFDAFEVTVGDITAARGHGAPDMVVASYQTYDLTQASAGAGQLIATMQVPGGAYDHIAYRVESIHVEGTATDGVVTKTFTWDLATPTTYSECESIAVVDGDTAVAQLTIHADHLFYDDLVSEEPNVAFELIATADDLGDGDGDVTAAELAALDITGEARYQVGNFTEVTDLWTFIDYQSSTVGHIDGEGHCGGADRE